MKEKIYRLVEKGAHGSKVNVIFDYFIMSLIILNVVVMMFESVPSIGTDYKQVFYIFEIFSVIVFSIEYMMRIYVADLTHKSTSKTQSVLKFIFSAYGLIDLIAILPFFLPFFFKIDFRFLRVIRLTRFLRIIKIDRYTKSLNTILNIIKDKKGELIMTGFLALIILLISSFLMYEVEGRVQPNAFPNVIASLWWAIATLTTIGYGDVYPVTALGKLISGIIAVLGIGLIALPTGIIGSGFMEKIQKKEAAKCPHCGKEIEKTKQH